MSRCPNCHATVDPDERFCPKCGELLERTTRAPSGNAGPTETGSSPSTATGPGGSSPEPSAGASGRANGYPRPPTPGDTDVFLRRAGALVADSIILGALAFVVNVALVVLLLFVVASGSEGGTSIMAQIVAFLPFVFPALLFLYFVFLEGTWDGQTLGKRLAGIKVVKETGEQCDLAASAIRNLLRVVDTLVPPYLPGIVSIVVSDERQRIGDRIGSTVVVKERS